MAHNGNFCWIFGFLVLGLAVGKGNVVMAGSSRCDFPAIFNFGDSNSDTGGRSAAFTQVPPPYGMTFFRKPSGRLSDGRLIVDFMAETLDLSYLSAYLDSIDTDFEDGANFGTGGSSIRPGGFSPFDLSVQISQFKQFKSRTAALDTFGSGKKSPSRSDFADPEDFSKALYTLDIGQNDLIFEFQNMTQDQIRASFPDIMNRFGQAIEQLYNDSARAFWIHNTGPVGCIPYIAIPFKVRNGTLDQYGCAKPINDMALEFNQQLLATVNQLKTQFPLAKFTYVDIYSAKFELITNAKNLGFDDPLNFCCGSFEPFPVFCGMKIQVNGTVVVGSACNDPNRHISWDGVHYTEAANSWIATRLLSGSLSNPPVPIGEACP